MDTTLADLCKAGEGGADGSIRGVCGGVRPDDTLPMLLVDDFLLTVLQSDMIGDSVICDTAEVSSV